MIGFQRRCVKIRPGRKEMGVSLIELVIVIIITGIIVLAISPFLRTSIGSYYTVRVGKDAMQEARIGFNRLVNEIKRIPLPGNIFYADASTLQFSYVQSNGIISNQVNYSYETTTKMLNRNGFRLIEAVSAFTLSYFASDGTAITPLYSTGTVHRIRIDMTLGTGTRTYRLTEEIYPKAFGRY
jgi:hypothetical protein